MPVSHRRNDLGRRDIVLGDNLHFLRSVDDAAFDLIYIDPPFNTGKTQTRNTVSAKRTSSPTGRTGFAGARYVTTVLQSLSFADAFDDFGAFLIPRLEEAHRVLRRTGSLFVHLDPRESHYCKVWLDQIFGRKAFMNEIVWAYDFGGRSRTRWSSKHDNILWYAKDPSGYTFNFDEMDRIPYMAPGLVGPEKALRGKTPTDTWWHTIVPTNGSEKTGYPTQKPLGIVDRIVRVHSNPGDLLLDFFAGSGTLGDSAARHGRQFVLVDSNPAAVGAMRRRLAHVEPAVQELTSQSPAKPPAVTKSGKSGTSGVLTDDDANTSLISVLVVTVGDYKKLARLDGPAQDAKAMEAIFSTNEDLALYAHSSTFLHNPTVEQLRSALVNYTTSRSARGDILIFYFSGHGAVLGGANNEFGFCTVDTERAPDDGAILPLSVVNFRDVVRTLAAADVHPVFIVDACFSGAITGIMHDNLARHAGGAYAFLCSSYEATPSIDTRRGGIFTTALRDVLLAGKTDKEGKRRPFLALGDIASPLQQALARAGHPLSRCHLGADLPSVPLVRNTGFAALRYSFTEYMSKILDHMWNGGDPKDVLISEFAALVGNGAYGNHRKLSLEPWALVEDGDAAKSRRLTSRGIRFVKGKLSIPRQIERDPVTSAWKAAPGTDQVRRPTTASK
jgi:site-specific DNA-methyltransferase (adenine-specific)